MSRILLLKNIENFSDKVKNYDSETLFVMYRFLMANKLKGIAKYFLETRFSSDGLWNPQQGLFYLSRLKPVNITHAKLLEIIKEDDQTQAWYPFFVESKKFKGERVLVVKGYTRFSASSIPTMPDQLHQLFLEQSTNFFKRLGNYQLYITIGKQAYLYNRQKTELVQIAENLRG